MNTGGVADKFILVYSVGFMRVDFLKEKLTEIVATRLALINAN